MEIKILYHPLVIEKDIPRLDTTIKKKVISAIERKLMTAPTIFGLPLRKTLARCWKLRVEDWRIIYDINKRNVRILTIGHRSEVYKVALKRI